MSRTLANSNIPLQGKININRPVMLVSQQDTGIYILCLVKYDTTGPNNSEYELIFSPYFSGDFKAPTASASSDNTANLIVGLSYNESTGLYENISSLTAVNTEKSATDFYKISTVTVAILLFNPDGRYSVLNGNGNFLGYIQVYSGTSDSGAFQCAIVGDTGTVFINTANDSLFNYPNIYAGEIYSFNYAGNSPFRFFIQMNQTQDNYLLTPSVCVTILDPNIPQKSNEYECNEYSVLSIYNLLRYISYFSYTDPQTHEVTNIAKANFSIAGSQQTNRTFYNFYPTGFYPSNVFFQDGKMSTGPNICYNIGNSTLSYDASAFMQYVFYFWASGFSSIISQGSPGFIGKGQNYPINITGWTTQSDCERSYFYTYCNPDTTANTCGECLGTCTSKLPCSANPSYTPQSTPQGSTPFMCGIPPTPPPPSKLQTFWEQYKEQISILIVIIIIVGIAFIAFVVFTLKSKPENSEEN